eukprot:7985950-Lingulodinium_polyedra.AAC.1
MENEDFARRNTWHRGGTPGGKTWETKMGNAWTWWGILGNRGEQPDAGNGAGKQKRAKQRKHKQWGNAARLRP